MYKGYSIIQAFDCPKLPKWKVILMKTRSLHTNLGLFCMMSIINHYPKTVSQWENLVNTTQLSATLVGMSAHQKITFCGTLIINGI